MVRTSESQPKESGFESFRCEVQYSELICIVLETDVCSTVNLCTLQELV